MARLLFVLVAVLAFAPPAGAQAPPTTVILSTTTSTQDSGLLDVAGGRFVSRGDKSGTHVLEQGLWKQAGVTPSGAWYIESGQGMGATLGIADDRKAYTLTDRATLLAFGKRARLVIMVEGDRP